MWTEEVEKKSQTKSGDKSYNGKFTQTHANKRYESIHESELAMGIFCWSGMLQNKKKTTQTTKDQRNKEEEGLKKVNGRWMVQSSTIYFQSREKKTNVLSC